MRPYRIFLAFLLYFFSDSFSDVFLSLNKINPAKVEGGKKIMAPPGIEPGLTQNKTPQCVVIPLDHGTYQI